MVDYEVLLNEYKKNHDVEPIKNSLTVPLGNESTEYNEELKQYMFEVIDETIKYFDLKNNDHKDGKSVLIKILDLAETFDSRSKNNKGCKELYIQIVKKCHKAKSVLKNKDYLTSLRYAMEINCYSETVEILFEKINDDKSNKNYSLYSEACEIIINENNYEMGNAFFDKADRIKYDPLGFSLRHIRKSRKIEKFRSECKRRR